MVSTNFADLLQKHDNPISLQMFDGSPSSSGKIISFIDTTISFTHDTPGVKTRLHVTKLLGAQVVLGANFMIENSVTLDLASGTISLFSSMPSTSRSVENAEIMETAEPAELAVNVEPLANLDDSTQKSSLIVETSGSRSSDYVSSTVTSESPATVNVVSEILPSSFSSSKDIVMQENDHCFLLQGSRSSFATFPNTIPLSQNRWRPPVFSELRNTESLQGNFMEHSPILADNLSELADPKEIQPQFDEPLTNSEYQVETQELQAQVPMEYHEYLDVFRKGPAKNSLPPSREYDMRIDLVPGAVLRPAKLYNLSETERQVLLETLEREVASGRIRPSTAAFGSPTFFVPKKNGQYRMVVDYRHLNSQTIADVYPLPLIAQIFNEVRKAKYFTRFDLVGAYQLLRVKEEHVHRTAFRTQYGMFESLVVRDGLRNAPAVFQHFLNEVFREVLGKGVVLYIDDGLIYAETKEELRRLTTIVLEICRKSSLYLSPTKCEFEVEELPFLGFIISNKGIKTDPSKVAAIQEFPVPQNAHQSRSFMGLATYYRRFIKDFSAIAAPIHTVNKNGGEWSWGDKQQEAFDKLKAAFTTAPVLAHYDPTLQTILQTDASFFGWGFVLSQINAETGLEHPIIYESGRFRGAELNYSTNEKELMAIVEAFNRCRHMLLPVRTTVITDHLNLVYWMRPRPLGPRQARWVEMLSPYKMDIIYRPGKQAAMPDALSRRPDYHPGKGTTNSLDLDPKQALPSFVNVSPENVENRDTSSATLQATLQGQDNNDELVISAYDLAAGQQYDEEIQEVRDEMMAVVCAKCSHPTCLGQTPYFPSVTELRKRTRNPLLVSPNWSPSGLIRFGRRIYVSNIAESRLKILQNRHDSKLAGHPGITKTLDLIMRDYVWIGLRNDTIEYINGCSTCQRVKTSRQRPHGFLKTLEVPQGPWQDISMDFIEELPKSSGYNSILVVVDRLTKWAVFIPTKTTLNSTGLADILIKSIFSIHGLPKSIVSDRGSKFISKLWREVTNRLGITLRLSTAFHPQTDGQTERVNQSLEQYLGIFTSYKQDDWADLLHLAAFTYNNTVHSAIQMTPFFANFGYHPRWAEEILPASQSEIPVATEIVETLRDVHELCRNSINIANESYARFYDQHRQEAIDFKVGDRVMLSSENIKTTRPSKKLDAKQLGPFTISEVIGTHAYRLNLPWTMKNHDVFHVSLLTPFVEPTFPNQQPTEVIPEVDDDGELKWEVAEIVDSRHFGRTKKVQYLIRWKGFEGTPEEYSWEPIDNLNCDELLEEFKARNPDKPFDKSKEQPLRRSARLQ